MKKAIVLAIFAMLILPFMGYSYSENVFAFKAGASWNHLDVKLTPDDSNSSDSYQGWGYAAGLSYELNFNPLFVVIGGDFIHFRVDTSSSGGDKWLVVNYISPSVIFRFQTSDGFYIGLGAAAMLPAYYGNDHFKSGEGAAVLSIGMNFEIAPQVYLAPEIRTYYFFTDNASYEETYSESSSIKIEFPRWTAVAYIGVASNILGHGSVSY